MRSQHISSSDHYKQYYLKQATQKGGGPYFAGRLFQKGAGIGSIFASLFKRALPFLSRASNHIGKAALKTGANVLADTVSGQRFQDSLKNRVKETGRELKRDAVAKLQNAITTQTGSGRKRKAQTQTKNKDNKKQKNQTKTKSTQKNRKVPIKNTKGKKPVTSKKARKPRTYQDIFG